jgi:cysteine desulfurase/selenocysteine lyase
VAEFMAERNICIRAGHHCTEPLMKHCNITGSFRMSLYLYNDKEDIDKFFEVLEEFLDTI